MIQTRDQKRFTVSEVAADWRVLKVPQCSMQPSITRGNEHCSATVQPADIPPPQSAALGIHPLSNYSFSVPLKTGG